MPTGMTMGLCVYQLMVVTRLTASIVKRIVLPVSFGKRIGTRTTELAAFLSSTRRQRDELVAAGVGCDPDLGGDRVAPVGDDLEVEVVEGDASGERCLHPGADLGRAIKARAPKGLRVAVEGEHSPGIRDLRAGAHWSR